LAPEERGQAVLRETGGRDEAITRR
jgi:hypothetical protein